MEARQFAEEGRLDDAIQSLNNDIRSSPKDVKLRTFLFELLLFTGDLERAAELRYAALPALAQEVEDGQVTLDNLGNGTDIIPESTVGNFATYNTYVLLLEPIVAQVRRP